MLKFGLLLVLANLFLKLFLGVGIWKMAMEGKTGVKSSLKYDEEPIGEPGGVQFIYTCSVIQACSTQACNIR